MKHACCSWCLRFVKVEDHYNPQIHRAYCCPQCAQADWMFRRWMSDEEINRRRHYRDLTKGEE